MKLNKTKKNTKFNLKNSKISKINNDQKISITIDWNSKDYGLSSLSSSKVHKFLLSNLLQGNNLIQTQHNTSFKVTGKTILKLQAVKFNSWKVSPHWNNENNGKVHVMCKKFNDFIKTTPCNTGKKRSKIFLKFKSNKNVAGFALYLLNIFSGEIDIEKHKQFARALKKTFKNNDVIIHNEDVNWFHMKQI